MSFRKTTMTEKIAIVSDLEWAFQPNDFVRSLTPKQLTERVLRWCRVEYPHVNYHGRNFLVSKIVEWYTN